MSQPIPNEFAPYQQTETAGPPPTRRRSGVAAVVAILLTLGAVAVILNESVFRIRQVAVVGNAYRTWNEIVSLAKIDGRQSYFSLNEKEIAAGINSDRYLIFEKLEKNFPNGLTIYVRERRPIASIQQNSATYRLAADGMVLERAADEVYWEGIVMVTGLRPKELRVGRAVVAGSADHMEAFEQVLGELSIQGWAGQISELNLTDPDSLYLVTRDGFTIHLGDRTDLRAKIGTVRGVVDKLRDMGKKDGLIEASLPGEATYSPMNP